MLDDVADKARRNLMIVSNGILAVAALGIPLDGKLVGAVDLGSVEPWRAWITIIVVLIYFAARYRLAPSTVEKWADWAERRQKKFNAILRFSLQHALGKKLERDHSSEVNLVWQDHRDKEGALEPGLPVFPKIGKRTGEFEYFWRLSPEMEALSVTLELDVEKYPTEYMWGEYRFTPKFYLKAHWRAVRHAYKPSWDLLELSLPWVVAFAAAIVCVIKLGFSLYYEFPFVRQLLST